MNWSIVVPIVLMVILIFACMFYGITVHYDEFYQKNKSFRNIFSQNRKGIALKIVSFDKIVSMETQSLSHAAFIVTKVFLFVHIEMSKSRWSG